MYKIAFFSVFIGIYMPAIMCQDDDSMKELIENLRATCSGESGMDLALVDKVNTEKKFIDDEKLKCYVKCLMVQTGCIDDDGMVDPEAVIALLPDGYRQKAEATIRECGAKKGANSCESAWLTHKCYMDTKPDVYMLI